MELMFQAPSRKLSYPEDYAIHEDPNAPIERNRFNVTTIGHLEVREALTKRADLELPESVGSETGAAKGPTADPPPSTESEGNTANTGEASNSENNGVKQGGPKHFNRHWTTTSSWWSSIANTKIGRGTGTNW